MRHQFWSIMTLQHASNEYGGCREVVIIIKERESRDGNAWVGRSSERSSREPSALS